MTSSRDSSSPPCKCHTTLKIAENWNILVQMVFTLLPVLDVGLTPFISA